ncbi:MAG: hypothetical protein IPK64_20940 [bacterium]|nr:hypothetical protein [bacterium]
MRGFPEAFAAIATVSTAVFSYQCPRTQARPVFTFTCRPDESPYTSRVLA